MLSKDFAVARTSKGQEIIIDADKLEWAQQYTWMLRDGYACRKITVGTRRQEVIKMHRELLGLGSWSVDKRIVDHVNHNKLDNRLSNLRIATKNENEANKAIRSDNTSGFKGVNRKKNCDRWEASIQSGGKKIYLGLFETPEEAAIAYNKKAVELFDEFACLNLDVEVPSPTVEASEFQFVSKR